MKTWSTSDASPRERFSFWADVVSATFARLECSARKTDGFVGALRHRRLDRMGVSDVFADPQTAERSRAMLSLGTDDMLIVMLQLYGECQIQTHTEENMIAAGEGAIVAADQWYRLNFPSRFRQIVLKMPRPAGSQSGKLFNGACLERGAVRVLRHIVMPILDDDETLPTTVELACEVACFQITKGGMSVRTSRNEQLYRNALSIIDARLSSTLLRPERLANQVGCSVRNLNRIFAANGDSIEKAIWIKRLNAIRNDLCNPGFRSESITKLAHDHGFSDMSHFSRRFKQAFGVTPGQFRNRRLDQSSD